MSKYLQEADNDDDNADEANAIAIPQVFSENSRAKKLLNPIKINKVFTLPNWKGLKTTILNLMKMA